jgi:hypothetical protein
MASALIQMGRSMKVNGKMENLMVRELKFGLMAGNTKGNGKGASLWEQGLKYIQMESARMVTGKRVNSLKAFLLKVTQEEQASLTRTMKMKRMRLMIVIHKSHSRLGLNLL